MRKLLLLFAILTVVACQKDFYLEDLNSAQDRIQQLENTKSNLESQVSSLQTQISGLNNDNAQLQQELNTITSAYEAGVLSLEEAQEQIKDLQERVDTLEDLYDDFVSLQNEASDLGASSVLDSLSSLAIQIKNNNITLEDAQAKLGVIDLLIAKHIGIKNGIYKTVKVRRGLIMESLDDANASLLVEPWGETGQETHFEITNNRIVDFGIKEYYHDRSSIEGLTGFHWFGKGVYQNDQRINTVLEITGRNEVLLSETIQWDDDRGLSIWQNRLILVNESPSEFSINGNEITRDEITSIYREKKLGFYSDEIYSTLSVDDHYTFLEAFIMDAERNGLDLSHLRNQKFDFQESVNYGYGVAYGRPCDDNAIWIAFEGDAWKDAIIHDLVSDIIYIFWHEFGHAALNLQHNRVQYDIMYAGGSGEFAGAGPEIEGAVPSDTVEGFKIAATRMFQNINQQSYDCGFATAKNNLILN